MNKKIIGISLALLFASGVAHSQSSVTMYGIVDAGIGYTNGNSAGKQVTLSSGGESGSRIGFRGTEDLGDGLKALFVLETGIDLDTGSLQQGGRIFGRQAYVGVMSDALGTVSVGRQYSPMFNAYILVDAFGYAGPGSIQTLFGQGTTSRDYRMDNTLAYKTPGNLGGFNGELAYSFGEQAGSFARSSQFGGSVGYANGPVAAVYSYHRANLDTAAASNDSFKNHLLGGTYDFGMVKLYAAVGRTTEEPTVRYNGYSIGARVPVGKHSIFGSVARRDNKKADNSNATHAAIGYSHVLSKRTDLYSILAYTKNDSLSKINTDVGGKSVTQVRLGMRHRF